MKSFFCAAALAAMLAASPARAEETLRGYVTQIEVNSATSEVRIWLAPEKGMKGMKAVEIDASDPLLRFKIDLARDSLTKRFPIKVRVNDRNLATAVVLRVYPSSKQLAK